ncbi:MAG: hypothetical protein J1F35_05665 [Erysipelotrichales bacterium]|nr:hypothetical protein [Erysipelotrichales bacterium]
MKTSSIIYSILLDNNIVAVFDTLEMARLDFQSAKEAYSGDNYFKELTLVDSDGVIHLTHNF